MDSQGNQFNDPNCAVYQRKIEDGEEIDRESLRARITPPNLVISDSIRRPAA
jgi:hypothetical protein